MGCKKLMDKNDPREVRLHEDRLSKRLKTLGYSLSKGKTETAGPQKKQLKRIPPKRGFRITDMATGAVILGEKYNLTLARVETFWLEKHTERIIEKRKAALAKEERRRQESSKVETFSAVWY